MELPFDIPSQPHGRDRIIKAARDSAAKKKPSKKSRHEDALEAELKARGFPMHARHYRFAKAAIGRQWHFDFAFLDLKIAIEVEGLVVRRIGGQMVSMGRHANVAGFREDCLKYAWAAVLGWTVLRFEQSQIKGDGIDMIERLFAARGWKR